MKQGDTQPTTREWKCDCCGDPHPRGCKLTLREDGVWEESILSAVQGPLALNSDGEDWLCSACLRSVDVELQKWKRLEVADALLRLINI